MKKKIIKSLLLLVPLAFILSGCASSLKQSEMAFGIKAAQAELWDEAIFRWNKVVMSNPKSAAAHNNLAVAYEKKGLLEDAEKEYRIAQTLEPNNKYVQSNYEKFKKRSMDGKKDKNEKN